MFDLRTWLPWLLCLTAWLTCGCKRDDAAKRCAQDRATIQALMAEDQRVSGMSHAADKLALDGRPLEAAERIEKGAQPAMRRVVNDAKRFAPQSKWGADRKDDLVPLVQQRQELLTSYAAALRAENLQRVLAQMEKQRDLERRAMQVKRSVATAPDPVSDACRRP
ncbi:MAG: hypothetical protein ACOC1F_04575 [Myxococcota bacterium]